MWQTAVVAIAAALLGSIVGGVASFRASEALEIRRREARAKIRRKAKVYTPIRSELIFLKERLAAGVQFGLWGIMREAPPPLMIPPASLHLWKDLSDDGRSLTAASAKIRTDLDEIDDLADSFNEQLIQTRQVFGERGEAILAEMGEGPRTMNWLDVDIDALVDLRFDDLSVTGTTYEEDTFDEEEITLNPEQLRQFEANWKGDQGIATATQELLEANSKLDTAITQALLDLDAAIEKIAKKYERESPED